MIDNCITVLRKAVQSAKQAIPSGAWSLRKGVNYLDRNVGRAQRSLHIGQTEWHVYDASSEWIVTLVNQFWINQDNGHGHNPFCTTITHFPLFASYGQITPAKMGHSGKTQPQAEAEKRLFEPQIGLFWHLKAFSLDFRPASPLDFGR